MTCDDCGAAESTHPHCRICAAEVCPTYMEGELCPACDKLASKVRED